MDCTTCKHYRDGAKPTCGKFYLVPVDNCNGRYYE